MKSKCAIDLTDPAHGNCRSCRLLVLSALLFAMSAISVSAGKVKKAATAPFPGHEQADLWILAGQSNMVGWGLLKANIAPDPRIWSFNNKGEWVQTTAPVHDMFVSNGPVHDNIALQRANLNPVAPMQLEAMIQDWKSRGLKLGGVGLDLPFAKALIEYTNRPIGLINFSAGGQPIKVWDRTNSDSFYQQFIAHVRKVKGPFKGMLWYQGESDALMPEEAPKYEQNLLNLIDNVRSDLNAPELPFICIQVGRYALLDDQGKFAPLWEQIREAQRRVMQLRKNVYTVGALDLLCDDPIHVSFEGQQRLGRRLAEIALSEVYRMPGHGQPIDFESVEVIYADTERSILRVRFKGVTGRLKSEGRANGFELRQPGPGVNTLHTVYRVDFDPADPSALIVGVFHPFASEDEKLIYGPGLNPYANIVDERDIPVPAFGPVALPLAGRIAKKPETK